MELKHDARVAVQKTINLLIVPYGIETTIEGYAIVFGQAFNRTLWN